MNSIIVLLLLSASVASAQTATSKAAAPRWQNAYDWYNPPCKRGDRLMDSGCRHTYKVKTCLSAKEWVADPSSCMPPPWVDREEKQETWFTMSGLDINALSHPTAPAPEKAKPKPSVKAQTLHEFHCPGPDNCVCINQDCHSIPDPKPQEEPKKDSLTGFGTNTPIVFQAAPSEAKGDTIQLKDDPSKLCDALSPTEKVSCLMNIVAPAADESKPYVFQPQAIHDMPATLLMPQGVHDCTYAFEANCRFAIQVRFDGTLNQLLFTQWDKEGKIYTISTDGYGCHALADSDPKVINADSLIIECRRTR